ncbi:MAG: 50S ribosomal protein L32 [Candidatus Portnoybacteria bacterium CG_4_8_14_3_um_filter_44_10]|uniref:Large ribosomal subunit protein bL32 n=5 Tax=Candidatus Portnoyibacteriota TaxID=1817913 RepID=A0A2H0KRH6_9BACT|nr:MAG: 50S ribosomal protein L32 [Parcubacteria group bacterium CG2_30_44_18]PIQ74749.1 MAG: 50S ribosomal protein L32 [Candidatus Portnoybacteria bacterium CG11_big_fil_rev_8_21_14_0_20_44_10]PIS16195.1 MAG: 50S ribosomal protein L32 [Candidatus Portnoybacteria bacterium CG09_land_8_20_14_0_10_44_13]PIW75351.1 MAG: 50S ribosomal protein L32 [Candidatus Portnoybacteria bacterium CG_4_8_14_3_um_filter_44_10]PIZ68904.1 MAG: 50S ribosomal protein L32 [Candidatus Portnoybacteria bacterium CG_4_10_
MPIPKQRHTKGRRNRRRSHHALKKLNLIPCAKCGEKIMPHQVCFNCGTYAGREMVDVLAKLTKKEKKMKERELAAAEASKEKEKPMSMDELSKTT